jgi:hypothetical protein
VSSDPRSRTERKRRHSQEQVSSVVQSLEGIIMPVLNNCLDLFRSLNPIILSRDVVLRPCYLNSVPPCDIQSACLVKVARQERQLTSESSPVWKTFRLVSDSVAPHVTVGEVKSMGSPMIVLGEVSEGRLFGLK